MNFQAGFTFANKTRMRVFKGFDFLFSTLTSQIFYTQCSKPEELFEPFKRNRMVKSLLAYWYTRCKRSYRHTISTILDGQWMVLCWYCMALDKCGCKQKCSERCKCKKHGLPCTELCSCSGGCMDWEWLLDIWDKLAVQCVGCISLCVVSCYSTIKVLKNNCWNVPSPIYLVFGYCP